MIDIYTEQNLEIKWLRSLKENHDLSNREIAENLGRTEATISNWLNGKSKPSKQSKEEILSYIKSEWQPGIIELPPTPKIWSGPYYLRVRDVRAPFDTWVDVDWSGNTPETHSRMIRKWEEQCKKDGYKIRKIYSDLDEFYCHGRIDETTYNCTYAHYHDNYKKAYESSWPHEIAWDLIYEFEEKAEESEVNENIKS